MARKVKAEPAAEQVETVQPIEKTAAPMSMKDYLDLEADDLLAHWIAWNLYELPDLCSMQDPIASAIFAFRANGSEVVAESLAAVSAFDKKEPKTVGAAKAKELLSKMKAKNDFSPIVVEFIKRTNGQPRKMVCRFGETRFLAGGSEAYNPRDHDLHWVWDIQAAGFRSIPGDGIVRMKIHGQTYLITENLDLLENFS